MTIPKVGPQKTQVKYELSEENNKTALKSNYIWAAFILIVLGFWSSTIALYINWQHMLNAAEKDKLDFLINGPKKEPAVLSLMAYRRGEMYGQAIKQMSQELVRSEDQLLISPAHEHTEHVEFKRVCYYNLAINSTLHVLTPDMISPDLCTHINIAFAAIINGTIQPAFPSDIQNYAAVNALKKTNPKLKVMLSVQSFSSTGEFAWIVSSAEKRTRFVESALQLLEENELDGLDIDWEFPSWPSFIQDETVCFMELLRLLSSKFHQREPALLLSVAVGAPKAIIDKSYNITAMAQYVDFVNIMAYDYHMYQSYLPLTGANAPLFRRESEKGYFTTLNLNWTASYWLFKGMPASKIVIGIPTYGRSYTLENEENHAWDAPSVGVGSMGTYGFVSYYDVCTFLSLGGVQLVFDHESKVPYTYKNNQWISFENEQSVAYKAEFAKENLFGGVMIYWLNTDDVDSSCGGSTKFPLTERIKSVLQDDQL